MMYYGKGYTKLQWDKESPNVVTLFFPRKIPSEANWSKWMSVEKDEEYEKSNNSYLRVNFWFQVALRMVICRQ